MGGGPISRKMIKRLIRGVFRQKGERGGPFIREWVERTHKSEKRGGKGAIRGEREKLR